MLPALAGISPSLFRQQLIRRIQFRLFPVPKLNPARPNVRPGQSGYSERPEAARQRRKKMLGRAVAADRQPQESRAAVDDANAWLAICRLASETANNEVAAGENRPDKMVDTDSLWSVAIDRVQAWVTEAV
jgi:hypothetical protein